MKRIVIAVVFAVGSSSVALVGTFALYNWSGLYIGAHVAGNEESWKVRPALRASSPAFPVPAAPMVPPCFIDKRSMVGSEVVKSE